MCVEGWDGVQGGLSHYNTFTVSLSGCNYANSMYIAVALEARGVLKAPRSFSPVTVLGCY